MQLAGVSGGGQLTATTISKLGQPGYVPARLAATAQLPGLGRDPQPKSFNATSLAKLYLDAYVSTTNSTSIRNSIQVGSMVISAPSTGKAGQLPAACRCTISALTGNVALTLRSRVSTYYALDGGVARDTSISA